MYAVTGIDMGIQHLFPMLLTSQETQCGDKAPVCLRVSAWWATGRRWVQTLSPRSPSRRAPALPAPGSKSLEALVLIMKCSAKSNVNK